MLGNHTQTVILLFLYSALLSPLFLSSDALVVVKILRVFFLSSEFVSARRAHTHQTKIEPSQGTQGGIGIGRVRVCVCGVQNNLCNSIDKLTAQATQHAAPHKWRCNG